jgi:mannitol-1-phosphate/altronate dehydrogenase
MIESAEPIEAHLQRLVDAGINGIDIMHGQLKLDMLQAEQEYTTLYEEEEADDFSDAMQSMDRKYAEGFLDAIAYCYKMTYDISFAISDKEAKE